MEFAPLSHELEHRPKSSKAGLYKEITFTGLLNDLAPTTLQVLNTIEYHEVVMLITDRKKFTRIAGNTTAAMLLQSSQKVVFKLEIGFVRIN